MRLIFMGTPDFSVPALAALHEAGHEIVAVYTQPPRPAGRGHKDRKSPVHLKAEELNIPVYYPESLKAEEEQKKFADLKADVAVVVAYGLLLPKPVLEASRCINIHASLLPRWRGAAPIHRAILAGDQVTGVTIMDMDEGLDTGDILLKEEYTIPTRATTGMLHDTLSAMGARLIVKALSDISDNVITPEPQGEGVTYAHKIKKEEAHIDWSTSIEEIDCQVRGFNPYPGAFCEYNGVKIKILDADYKKEEVSAAPGTILESDFRIAASDGVLYPKVVQRAGKRMMSIEDYLRGYPVTVGEQLV